MKTKTMVAYVCIICVVMAGVAVATPITFIHTGKGSGTLNGVPFAASSFVITSQGDTSNRMAIPQGIYGWKIDNSASSITIAGLGTFDVLVKTLTFVNNERKVVGYSWYAYGDLGGADLFTGPNDNAFGTWDMLTPIGPISGVGRLLQWNSGPVNTTGGILRFTVGTPNAVFAAIPEPTTIALFALGGLVLRKR